MLAFKLDKGTFIRHLHNTYMAVYHPNIPPAGNFYLQYRFTRRVIDPFSGIDASFHSFACGVIQFIGGTFVEAEIRIACREDQAIFVNKFRHHEAGKVYLLQQIIRRDFS